MMSSLVTMKRVLSFSGVTLVRMHLYGKKHNVPKWGTKHGYWLETMSVQGIVHPRSLKNVFFSANSRHKNGYAPTIASPQIHLQMGQFHRKRLDFLGPNT